MVVVCVLIVVLLSIPAFYLMAPRIWPGQPTILEMHFDEIHWGMSRQTIESLLGPGQTIMFQPDVDESLVPGNEVKWQTSETWLVVGFDEQTGGATHKLLFNRWTRKGAVVNLGE